MKLKHIQKIQQRSLIVDAATKLTWLDRPTAAAYMGIGIKQQSLPASKIGGRVIVKRQDIDEYLRQCSPATHRLN